MFAKKPLSETVSTFFNLKKKKKELKKSLPKPPCALLYYFCQLDNVMPACLTPTNEAKTSQWTSLCSWESCLHFVCWESGMEMLAIYPSCVMAELEHKLAP